MKLVLFLLLLCSYLNAQDFIIDTPVSTTQVTATHVTAGTISSTGNISAVKYIGDGALLTGLSISPSWYSIQSIPTAVQNVSNGTVISSTTNNSLYTSATVGLIGGLTEGIVSITATTGTTAVNVSRAGLAYVSISSNTIVSLTGAVAGKSVQIFVKQDGTGGRRVDFASPTHHWNSQTSTTQITSGSTVSQWSWTTPDGVNWFGGLVGSGM